MHREPDGLAAHDKLYGYLVRTLRALPDYLSLSLNNPIYPNARFDTGLTMPCDNSGSEETGLQYLHISYWVTGIRSDMSEDCFYTIVGTWKSFGWNPAVAPKQRPCAAFARTPDGYRFTVQQSIGGHLSLSGASPPFPSGPLGSEAFPESITDRA